MVELEFPVGLVGLDPLLAPHPLTINKPNNTTQRRLSDFEFMIYPISNCKRFAFAYSNYTLLSIIVNH